MHVLELNRLTAVGDRKTSASRMPSVAIWNNCPAFELLHGVKDGFLYWNDFLGSQVQAANVAAAATTLGDGLVAFTGATAGGTVGQSASAPFGTLVLSNTTDGESVCVSALGGKNAAGQIVFEAGKKVWMEMRLKIVNITTNEHGFFCGFGEEALAVAAGVISAADALADKDLVGFHHTAVATTAVGTFHNTASGGGITTVSATATTIAADTYLNLGIYCDGTTVFFYKDGAQLANSVLLTATNFPDGEEMAFYLALVTGSGGGDSVLTADWLKIAMERAA